MGADNAARRARTISVGVVANDPRSAAAALAVLSGRPGLHVAGTALTVGALLHQTGPLQAVALEVPTASDGDVLLAAACLGATGASVVAFTTDGAPAVAQRAQLRQAGIALVDLDHLPRELLLAALVPLPHSPAWPGARHR